MIPCYGHTRQWSGGHHVCKNLLVLFFLVNFFIYSQNLCCPFLVILGEVKCGWRENTLTQFRPFSWRARICLQQLPSPILYHWWRPNLHHCKRWRSVLFNSHKQQRLFWKSGGYRWLSAHARLCKCTNVCVWWVCAKICESSALYMCICKWGKVRTFIYAFVLVSLGDLLLWSNKPTVSIRFFLLYMIDLYH